MKDCVELHPLLCRVAEGEADPAEALAVARHVPECTACRILLARERRLAEMLEQELDDSIRVGADFLGSVMEKLPEGPPPRTRKARRGLTVAGLAAFAALALHGLLRGGGDLGFGDRLLPGLPSAPNLEGFVDGLQQAAGLLLALVNALGVGLTPALPRIGATLWLAFGAAVPVGAAALAATAAVAFAAHRVARRRASA